jgi:hypothetical protein
VIALIAALLFVMVRQYYSRIVDSVLIGSSLRLCAFA